MSKKIKVCIILLNYKNWKDTCECLDSIYKTTYSYKHIIVIDNASNNGSIEKIKNKFPEIDLIENKENLGFSRACNIGIKKALNINSDYILLLNNDTIVHPSFLEPLINEGEDNPNVGILTGKIYYFNSNKIWYGGAKKGFFKSIHKGQGIIDKGQFNKKENISFASGCMMMIKKEVLEVCGFLDERFFFGMEDREYCDRVIKNGFKILYVPNSVIWHKIGGSLSLNPGKVYNGYLESILFIKTKYTGLKQRIILFIYNIYGKFAILRFYYLGLIAFKDIHIYNKAIKLAFLKGNKIEKTSKDDLFLNIDNLDYRKEVINRKNHLDNNNFFKFN